MFKKTLKSLVLVSACCVMPAFAGWQLDATQSNINFTSVKKDTVGEVHTFKQIQGEISDAGDFTLKITLSSVETAIPIRNDRIREFLFEVAKFPSAVGTGKIPGDTLAKLAVGSIEALKVPVQINLHGKTVSKDIVFKVTKLNAKTLWAVTEAPFILNAAEFELVPGVLKLAELAPVPNIAQAVPVTASLLFKSTGKP